MAEIKSGKNYLSKRGSKGKMTNIPLPPRGGKLTKNGQVYRNSLLDTDSTSQTVGTIRKLKGGKS